MRPYLALEEMIEKIELPSRNAVRRILKENRKLFQTVQGSTHNHQAWVGGYFDHVTEVMNIAVALFDWLGSMRPLPFTLSDALLVLFLHDIEKPWKYEVGPDGHLRHIKSLRTQKSQHDFRDKRIKEYGIVLTEDQKNALRYVHGELEDYTPRKRMMGPLATFCHLCDVTSARIWFNHPGDPWVGAQRVRNRIR